MPSTIQILAEKMMIARGMEYRIASVSLKHHIDGLNEVAFLNEMTITDNPDIFNHLLSIGLPRAKQDMAMARYDELTG